MAKTYADLKREYNQIYKQVQELSAQKKAINTFISHLQASTKNEFSQISRSEIKKYDMQWINFLEKAVNALSAIVENPKRNLKTIRNIVPIELAKKTTAESVVHLSQHSQYIKDIDERGNVIPGKILNIEAEDDYGIYENRFIKCLIDKLIIFCRKRYEFMKEHNETKDYDILTMKSSVVVNGVTFEYESKVKISQPSNDDGQKDYNEELFKKITMLVEKINFFKTTPFYLQVKDTKPVRSPILQTNIMLKNQNYKACYEVWKFLDTYDQLGISIRVKEQQGKFDDEYLKEIYQSIAMSELLMKTDRFHKLAFNTKRKDAVQPKLNKKIIDPSLDNTKFDLALTYGRDQLTKAQLAAIKRKQMREKARLKRQAERLKQQEINRLKKEKEKEKRRLALERQKQKLKEQKLKALEKQRQKLLERKKREAERRRLKALQEAERRRYLLEQEKLRRTRITVKRIAKGKDVKLLGAVVVTEDMIKRDEDFIIKKPIKKVQNEINDSDLIVPDEIVENTSVEEPQIEEPVVSLEDNNLNIDSPSEEDNEKEINEELEKIDNSIQEINNSSDDEISDSGNNEDTSSDEALESEDNEDSQ